MKEYIGVGVYADRDPETGDLILTTESGHEITNTIVVEYGTWCVLKAYISERFPSWPL